MLKIDSSAVSMFHIPRITISICSAKSSTLQVVLQMSEIKVYMDSYMMSVHPDMETSEHDHVYGHNQTAS